MKYEIEIPEIHFSVVTVEAPEGISRKDLIPLANKELEENGTDVFVYSRTLEEDEWNTRTASGEAVQ